MDRLKNILNTVVHYLAIFLVGYCAGESFFKLLETWGTPWAFMWLFFMVVLVLIGVILSV